MTVAATILAVEPRREFAERLYEQVSAHMPTFISVGECLNSLPDAFARSKELMRIATVQNSDWHLYLEDDQELTADFFLALNELMEHDADLIYLANRSIPIGQMGWMGRFRTNRLRQPSAGSHGLLYRTKFLASLLADDFCRPVDHWFWKHIIPLQHKVIQILSPVLAIHRGEESTLHDYKNKEHLQTHPANI